ncbi:unnamed protein product [Lymnaea stagnalis]|uniref:Uncharacterized protein n=1 Tax=Lymnaea stagnalis TaxID=6523 RepID=A0AAV2HY22_LYMST
MPKITQIPVPQRKEKSTLLAINLESIALLVTFICVNAVAFTIKPDVAAMMIVPNIFVLFLVDLVGRSITATMFVLAPALMAVYNTETFYILAVHSIFYLAILLHVAEKNTDFTLE